MTQRKNTHQTHLESLVFLGQSGLEELNDKIEGMIDFLEDNGSRLNQTVKIDGSPALFCWSSYEGYPNNSIALKGFTKGPETALSSLEDVDKKYPSEDRANMREMLKYGLEIAKHIPKGECWQGDCLFTKDSKREETILGDDYITFQPNKIIYAFSEDNPGYDKIKNADFGICFHTIYTGQDKRQSFNVDVSRLDLPSNIYVMSPALNVNRSKFNLGKIKTSFSRLEQLESDLLQTNEYEELVNNMAFMDYWNRFENASLADKKQTTIDTKTFLSDLVEFVEDKKSTEFEKKFASLKTEKGREKARSKYESELEELKQLIESNKSLLVKIVQTFNEAAKIKMFLWEGYKQSQMDYNTYYKSKTKGYIKGDMEGVAMSDQNGNIVKIVDRSAFSSYNRDPDIESGWEHNESLDEDLNSDFYNIDDIAKEYSISPNIIKQFILAVHKMPGKEIEDKDLEDWDCDESLDEELASFDIYEECSNYNEDALKKKFDNLLESIEEPLVIAFGRMNPITKGHQKLVDTMASLARGNKARLYLSHTQDKKKNPLSYEQKIKWAKEAFEPKIDVVESNARTLIEVLADLYKEGFKNIIYVGGEDRIGGAEDVSDLILRYNGQPDKQGNILYDFDSIQFKSAGSRDDESNDFTERASASLARKCAQEGDFESFKEIVPVENAEELYKEVRAGLGLQGSLDEALEGEDIFINDRQYKIKGNDKDSKRTFNVIMGQDHYALNWDNKEVKIRVPSLNIDDIADADVYHSNRIMFIPHNSQYRFKGVMGASRGKKAENEIGKNDKFISELIDAFRKDNKVPNNVQLTCVGEVKVGDKNSKLKKGESDPWASAFISGGFSDIPGEDVADNIFILQRSDRPDEQIRVNVSVKDGKTPSIINFGLSGKNGTQVIDPFVTEYGMQSTFGQLASKVITAINSGEDYLKLDQADGGAFNYSISGEELNKVIDKDAMLNLIRNAYRQDYYLGWIKGNTVEVKNVKDVVNGLKDITLTDATVTQSTVYVQFNSGGEDYALNIRRRSIGGKETAEIRANTKVDPNKRKGHNLNKNS